MSNLIEVAITSDANGALWSCCAWDPQAGTQLCTYKGKINDNILCIRETSRSIDLFPVHCKFFQVAERQHRIHSTLSTMNSS